MPFHLANRPKILVRAKPVRFKPSYWPDYRTARTSSVVSKATLDDVALCRIRAAQVSAWNDSVARGGILARTAAGLRRPVGPRPH